MAAIWIYRSLLIVRGGWALLEWFFDLGPKRLDSLSLQHPYASLVAHAIAVGLWLVILAGLWFFHRSARLVFVLIFALAVVTLPFRAHLHSVISGPPQPFAIISSVMLAITVAIVAMSFCPPIRDKFSEQT
jgi:hypothetical protein